MAAKLAASEAYFLFWCFALLFVYSWQKKLAAQGAYFFCFDVARTILYISRKSIREFVAIQLAAQVACFIVLMLRATLYIS
ncbi:hypothetical protein EGI11_08080 [Chryseobacterium sp. H3056]|uniref:Uncharacterized protein n=1 Tax=Kaistella daneshvariae TaxID=2487074 RepID=A0A3N0WRU9_9FLAO|nr:hypothetical protein EGI11_08080 [Kaistella daneshvariae]